MIVNIIAMQHPSTEIHKSEPGGNGKSSLMTEKRSTAVVHDTVDPYGINHGGNYSTGDTTGSPKTYTLVEGRRDHNRSPLQPQVPHQPITGINGSGSITRNTSRMITSDDTNSKADSSSHIHVSLCSTASNNYGSSLNADDDDAISAWSSPSTVRGEIPHQQPTSSVGAGRSPMIGAHRGSNSPASMSGNKDATGQHNTSYNIVGGGGVSLMGTAIVELERPLSAPPPPGFSGGGVGTTTVGGRLEERHRLANELLWGPATSETINNATSNNTNQSQHNHQNSSDDQRLSSFSNLEAVLGSGLVQSMEDATQDIRSTLNSTLSSGGGGGSSGISFNTNDNDTLSSYHRMTRHAANRLVGAVSHNLHVQNQQNHYNDSMNFHSSNGHNIVSNNSSINNNNNSNNNNNNNNNNNSTVRPPSSSLFQLIHFQNSSSSNNNNNSNNSGDGQRLDASTSFGQDGHHHFLQQQFQPPQQSSYALAPGSSSQGIHQQLFQRRGSLDAANLHHPHRGFPSSLSTPDRTAIENRITKNTSRSEDDLSLQEQRDIFRRSTTPVQLYPGHGSGIVSNHSNSLQHNQNRRALPTKDIGMHVVEPADEDSVSNLQTISSAVVSHRFDSQSHFPQGGNTVVPPQMQNVSSGGGEMLSPYNISSHNISSNSLGGYNVGERNSTNMTTLERGVQNMWHPDAPEFRPTATSISIINMGSTGNATGSVPLSSKSSSLSDLIGGSNNNNDILNPSTNTITQNISDNNVNHNVDTAVGGAATAEMELHPYLWEPSKSNSSGNTNNKKLSRTIAILRCSYLRVPDVRAAAESYGVLEGFRADFSSTKGIYFVSYYDIRSAQYASAELQSVLQRMSVMQRSSDEVSVFFCTSLTASSQFDESQILISDLPSHVSEYELRSLLSSYGSIRSIQNHHGGEGSYLVEFHNIQDSKQALLELDSTQPWGPNVTVEVGLRNPIERKKGRELLAIIGRWRVTLNRITVGGINHDIKQQNFSVRQTGVGNDIWYPASGGGNTGSEYAGRNPHQNNYNSSYGSTNNNEYAPHQQHPPQTQYIMSPDGRYTPVVLAPQASGSTQGFSSSQYSSNVGNTTSFDPRHQQVIQGPNGQIFITSVPAQIGPNGQLFLQQQSQHQHHGSASTNHFNPQGIPGSTAGYSYGSSDVAGGGGARGGRVVPPSSTPYYTHQIVSNPETQSLSGKSHRSGHSGTTTGGLGGGGDEKDTRHLLLDLDTVEHGHDARTSLMVRNIPNKYTQQMLLNEFEENGHGPGIIDFFYLPIDFKNRCNRGYAFINFVECRDIVAFHRRYYGKHWRTFNSDKICDITYARIQGKQAMLKRFENSALMEKDDEYKPLVFVSDGPDKGRRVPFPDPNALLNSTNSHHTTNHHHQHQHHNSNNHHHHSSTRTTI